MVEKGNALSRNPNVCASCSSMADGMAEPAKVGLEGDSAEASSPAEPVKVDQAA